MEWQNLTSTDQLETLILRSNEKPQLIFKHSTRCGISIQAKTELERGTAQLKEVFDLHYLDLLQNRAVSNEIAAQFSILHQSPQVLIIENKFARKAFNHYQITTESILNLE